MTYKLESFIAKIKSPVVCVFGDKETEYVNGLSLVNESFDEPWLVESITVSDNRLVLNFKRKPDTVVCDDVASFF